LNSRQQPAVLFFGLLERGLPLVLKFGDPLPKLPNLSLEGEFCRRRYAH
jgi:hypothetical protein